MRSASDPPVLSFFLVGFYTTIYRSMEHVEDDSRSGGEHHEKHDDEVSW